ncbi:hypothetical protein SAMN05446589_1433 [Streptomyces sp. OV198]|nr:hypothetical protein SAMN05446589_1433 [Streptomyces sp. OV198]
MVSGLASVHWAAPGVQRDQSLQALADGIAAGLEELEKHGFLLRDRARNADGMLGQALYCITDLPALQNPSSQPESGYPGMAEPVLADPGTKNTIVKKTNKQKTNPLRPCDRGDAAHTIGRTDPADATASPAPPPPADEMHPGIRLLLEIGASRPELLLTGKPLTRSLFAGGVFGAAGCGRVGAMALARRIFSTGATTRAARPTAMSARCAASRLLRDGSAG